MVIMNTGKPQYPNLTPIPRKMLCYMSIISITNALHPVPDVTILLSKFDAIIKGAA